MTDREPRTTQGAGLAGGTAPGSGAGAGAGTMALEQLSLVRVRRTGSGETERMGTGSVADPAGGVIARG